MNTHSREADCRMELMTAAAIEAGCDLDTAGKILRSINTAEGYSHIVKAELTREFTRVLMDKIEYYLNKRAAERLNIQCIVFSNEDGLLGETFGAGEMIRVLENG